MGTWAQNSVELMNKFRFLRQATILFTFYIFLILSLDVRMSDKGYMITAQYQHQMLFK